MRRDYFTLTVDGVGDGSDRRPVVTVGYEGPTGQLKTRMTKGETLLDDSEVDVGYRLRGNGEHAVGVVIAAVAAEAVADVHLGVV